MINFKIQFLLILPSFHMYFCVQVKAWTCPECQPLGPFTINLEEMLNKNYQRHIIQDSGRSRQVRDLLVHIRSSDECEEFQNPFKINEKALDNETAKAW